MITANNIREKLASYLANGIDLDSFEDWVVQNTWNIHLSSDLDAAQLAFSVELLLAEYSNDDLSEAALRDKLSLLSTNPTTGSSNQVVPQPTLPWQRVDIRDAVVF